MSPSKGMRSQYRVPGHSIPVRSRPETLSSCSSCAAGETGAHARCSCGLLSPHLPSDRTRRAWHDGHKATLDRDQEAFFKRLERTESGCWLWQGAISPNGYGRFWGRELKGNVSTHRYSYELARGPIPEGMQLDHLCRVRHCVNPDHLEPVTPLVNTMRGDTPAARNAAKTHCIRGHPFDEKNTYMQGNTGKRGCRACARRQVRESRLRKLAEQVAS